MAKFRTASLFCPKAPETKPPNQPGSFFDCRMLSMTILIGQGSRTSLKVSPSTATKARASCFQYGRMRRTTLSFADWFDNQRFLGVLGMIILNNERILFQQYKTQT